MEEIRKLIFANKDEKYKEFQSKLCPNINNIIGVRVPALKNIAKQIIKENNNIKYLNEYKCEYYEEYMLYGMLIGLSKIEINDVFEYLKIFIPQIDNWAVCDITCGNLKITKKHLKEMWKFLEQNINYKKEFESRFAIVMYLQYYLNDEYIDKVLQKINKLNNDKYYTKMAIAWLISVAYIKQRNKTLYFLKNNKLDKWTYNKALQKIIESNCIKDEEKNIIRKMKIK